VIKEQCPVSKASRALSPEPFTALSKNWYGFPRSSICNMNVRISFDSQNISMPFNIEKVVEKLLSKVPKEHLIGLETIFIVDKIRYKKGNNINGLYWPKDDRRAAFIEIAVKDIYKDIPKFILYLPFIKDFMMADVLYHEIGHHYQNYKHGISKNTREKFADNYKTYMLRREFRIWLLFMLPFKSLIRLLSNKLNNR
jgi:hypothetical protein